MVNIVVIGAGVVGLSSAINIQRVLPGAKVKVIADKFYDETTSIGAGAIFLPTSKHIPGVPPETIRRWSRNSWQFYSKMATSDLASVTGHSVSPGYRLHREKTETPLFANIVYEYRVMTQEELDKLGVDKRYRYGYRITTIVTNMSKYMAWLMTKFKENGGQVESRKIESFSELQGHCDVVVNCTALGSQQLCGDKLMYPIQGQLVKVEAPWLKSWVYTDDLAYIFPRDDVTVVGGVREKGSYSTTPDPAVRQGILDRCYRAWPALKGAKVVGDWAGLRPTREPVRLEAETLSLSGGKLKVVHNYGHGSNGVALSWGTAMEAAKLVKDVIIEYSAKL